MRRLFVAVIVVALAATLVACSSGPAPTETATPVPATGAATGQQPAVVAPNPNTDILSPLPGGTGMKLPTDPTSVPQEVLNNLTAEKPMLIFFYDPTTNVSKGQRTEINAAIKKYTGAITLVAIDYTLGVPDGSMSTTLPPEVDKAERLAGLLSVNTTPYIVFVDSSGTITFRFAGFVDRTLLRREIMRATQ